MFLQDLDCQAQLVTNKKKCMFLLQKHDTCSRLFIFCRLRWRMHVIKGTLNISFQPEGMFLFTSQSAWGIFYHSSQNSHKRCIPSRAFGKIFYQSSTLYVRQTNSRKGGGHCCLLMAALRPWDKLIPLSCISTIYRNNKRISPVASLSISLSPSLRLPPRVACFFSTRLFLHSFPFQ